MTQDIEAILQGLVDSLAPHPAIRAIGLSGGERRLPQPGEGDIDLFIYCAEIPVKQERKALLSSFVQAKSVEIGKLEGGHWGQGDCFFLAGVETWLLYFAVREAQAELEEILEGRSLGRVDSYYYPIGRCAMWKTMRALYDPDGFLSSTRERLREYPEGLAQAAIAFHRKALEDLEDLEQAVQRRDVFFFHFALDLALDHFLQAVFALNREYFPSRKRSAAYLQGFKVKPAACEERLQQVVALGGNPETLGGSYAIWKSLVRDLSVL